MESPPPLLANNMGFVAPFCESINSPGKIQHLKTQKVIFKTNKRHWRDFKKIQTFLRVRRE